MSPSISTAKTDRTARYSKFFGKPPCPPPKDPRFDPRFKSGQHIGNTKIVPTVNVTRSSGAPTTKSTAKGNATSANAMLSQASGSSQTGLNQKPLTRRLVRKDIHEILWYATAVIFPMTTFSAILLGLVYGYCVDSEAANRDIDLWENSSRRLHDSYIYVQYSATQLMFITSWSSSMAPVLISFLMKLWHVEVSRDIMEASKGSEQEKLTTPFQLSQIINMSTGALSELIFYVKYMFWKRKAKQPPVLTSTARILVTAGLLYAAIFAADTALHCMTPTVIYRKYHSFPSPVHSFGQGLDSRCEQFNRTGNGNRPCSLTVVDSFTYMSQAGPRTAASYSIANGFEVETLMNNRSQDHEIQLVNNTDPHSGNLHILLQRKINAQRQLDFVAKTVGVSTQCTPMTQKCRFSNPREEIDGNQAFEFNCSRSFYGELSTAIYDEKPAFYFLTSGGADSLTTRVDGLFAYFDSGDLEKAYATIPMSDSDDPSVPDSQLINPIYLGLVIAFPSRHTPSGDALLRDPEISRHQTRPGTASIALNCSFWTHDVEFRWLNGSISSQTNVATKDGSIGELYHGTISELSSSFTEAFQSAPLQNSSQQFANDFADLHSIMALRMIGSVMQPVTNLEEASWEDILVTQVPIVALWSLIAANMSFALLGLVLAIRAIKASSSPDLKDLVTKIGVAGMTAASLEDCPLADGKGPVMSEEELFEESQSGDASRRIGAYPNGRGGFHIVTFR